MRSSNSLRQVALMAALGGMGGLGVAAPSANIELRMPRGYGGSALRMRGKAPKTARECIPKAFRQYAKRYAKLGPDDVLAQHAQCPALPLDHWRDRGMALHKAMGLPVDPDWRKNSHKTAR